MVEKKPRIILWGGWYGSRNIGDRLLLLSITRLLQKEMGNCEFVIISATPKLVLEYFTVNSGSSFITIQPKNEFLLLLKELTQCDIFVFGGGVPFFNQYKQSLYMAIIAFTLWLFKKPYFLWCVSSYEIKSSLIKFIYKIIINRASKVTIRDRYTKKYMEKIGVNNSVEIITDSALSMTDFDEDNALRLIEKYSPKEIRDTLFALTPRTLRTKNTEAQTHYNEKKLEEIEHEILSYQIALDWLVEKGYTPIFIPMNTISPDDDREVSRQIMEISKYGHRSLLIDEVVPPLSAPAVYGYCNGSLVSRVHGSIASFLGECPPIMYAFENKHKGVMEAMGIEKLIFDPTHTSEDIIQLLEYLHTNRTLIVDDIHNRKEELRINASVPAKYIMEIFKNHSGSTKV